MSLAVRAPLAGTVVSVENVPDPVFSALLVGPGLAIDPRRADGTEVTVAAPVAGTVVKMHPHAFVIEATGGRKVLVHLGLDTVLLDGEGFTLHTQEGAVVSAGDPMVTWSPTQVEAGGKSPIVPVIALEADPRALALAPQGVTVTHEDTAFTWS